MMSPESIGRLMARLQRMLMGAHSPDERHGIQVEIDQAERALQWAARPKKDAA